MACDLLSFQGLQAERRDSIPLRSTMRNCPDDRQAKATAESWKFLYAVRLRLASRKAPTEQVRMSRFKPLKFQRFFKFLKWLDDSGQ